MPLPYAHFLLAQHVASRTGLAAPTDPEYLLGAFMPDIRYYTGQPRATTHFPTSRLDAFARPGADVSASFLLGYKVHLLVDEVWEAPEIKTAYRRAFLPPIRRRMTRGLEALTLELYCLRRASASVRLEAVENALTRSLGVTLADIERAVASMRRYLEHRDLAAALAMAGETGLFPPDRLRTASRLVALMRNPVVRRLVNTEVGRVSRPVFERIVTMVSGTLNPC